MRQRPVLGEQWNAFLAKFNMMPPGHALSREQVRTNFIDHINKQLKHEYALRPRKPLDTYNEDGTPKEAAASALPPFPCAEGADVKNSADMDVDGVDALEGPGLLSIGNFLGSEPDSQGGIRKKQRRGLERQFTESIRARYPEAKLYAQLQALERKVDSISKRKRMQVEEALKHPATCSRTLQIFMWNTHENQPTREQDFSSGDGKSSSSDVAKPTWTLYITGRVVDANGEEVKGEGQATLASLLERVFIQLPAHLYPDSHAIEWSCWDGGARGVAPVNEASGGGPATGFRVSREGADECRVRVMLHCTSNPKRFSLSGNPELGDLLGFESGSWSQLLSTFWAYVQEKGLHSDDDVLHVKLDEPLRQIFGEDRLPLRRVAERLSEMATQEQPIEITYPLKLSGEPQPVVFEALVQVEDPVMLHMRELMQSIAPGGAAGGAGAMCEEQELDEQIIALVGQVETHKRRRDFMAAFAERPLPFLQDLVSCLALDLRTIRCEGASRYGALGEEDLERAQAWQQPWTEEAVLHYLNMLGHNVPLKLEDRSVMFALFLLCAPAQIDAMFVVQPAGGRRSGGCAAGRRCQVRWYAEP